MDMKKILDTYVESLENDLEGTLDDALEVLKITTLNGYVRGYIVVLTTGGPHVEINTRDESIEILWGSDSAKYYLPSDLIEEIEDCLSNF